MRRKHPTIGKRMLARMYFLQEDTEKYKEKRVTFFKFLNRT